MADDGSHQLLETLASCLQALQKLSEALLLTLARQIRMSQDEEANGVASENGNVVGYVIHVNTNSDAVSRDNEANISGPEQQSHSLTILLHLQLQLGLCHTKRGLLLMKT